MTMKRKLLMLLTTAMLPLAGWCYDGDTFTITTVEGQTMTMMVLSEEDKTCQVGNNYRCIEDYEGPVTIPATANGYTVTRIGDEAFQYSGPY